MVDIKRADIYQLITDKIVAELEKGCRPWSKPWRDAASVPVRPTRSTGEPYRGINVLLLWSEASEKGYTSPYWFTFQQAKQLGAHVRKGERGTMVVYAGSIERTDENAAGEEIERRIPFLKSYNVFSANQIDGLDDRYSGHAVAPSTLSEQDRLPEVDQFFIRTGADIRHGGNRAFYSPGCDFIQMPHFQQFTSAVDYAATLAHEAVHWTKHETRLNRDFGRRSYGDEGYAREELVALS